MGWGGDSRSCRDLTSLVAQASDTGVGGGLSFAFVSDSHDQDPFGDNWGLRPRASSAPHVFPSPWDGQFAWPLWDLDRRNWF